jgi:hypothetical protein
MQASAAFHAASEANSLAVFASSPVDIAVSNVGIRPSSPFSK